MAEPMTTWGIRLPLTELADWRQRADAEGMTLGLWVRARINRPDVVAETAVKPDPNPATTRTVTPAFNAVVRSLDLAPPPRATLPGRMPRGYVTMRR